MSSLPNEQPWVPVVDKVGTPLMPCRPQRAKELMRKGKAKPRWKTGIFYIQLLERLGGVVQGVVIGIDPGSKKEGFSVKSTKRTFLNIQSDAKTDVKDKVETRRNMRRARRFRNIPCRKNRTNRARGGIPPSTFARWNCKLRIVNIIRKVFPVNIFIVEDIKAVTKGQKKWDKLFSPLEVGKKWFYAELEKLGKLVLKQGYETKELRDALGLKKIKDKLSNSWYAHCVDAWILANSVLGNRNKPDNLRMLLLTPLTFFRRQLHYLQSAKGGIRRNYGSTRSLGFKRGSLVKHIKWGLTFIGGTMNARLSLHRVADGKRLTQLAKIDDCSFIAYNSWKFGYV